MDARQLSLGEDFANPRLDVDFVPDLSSYARAAIAFSGGKDSVACVLHLLELGFPRDKIELHHHLVDGREGSTLMDWAVTESYARRFAEHFGLRIYFSWKVGGFEREMLRENSPTAPIAFEREDGSVAVTGGDRGKPGTRRKFPQVSPDLRVRWCSAYGKVDVGSRVLTSESRFREGKTLFITGERAEESSARARYSVFEPHRADNRNGGRARRHIDAWRPVHSWKESKVWEILKRHRINPHPAYLCGFARCSCLTCIFGSKTQWATIAKHFPQRFAVIANYERKFGVTIQRKHSVTQLAASGKPLDPDPRVIQIAQSSVYTEPIVVDDWILPAGAFGESCGPT